MTPRSIPSGFPAVLVPRKKKILRHVNTHCQHKSQTVKYRCPTPSTKESFDTLRSSYYRSTIDSFNRFYQVPVNRGCQDYTAFDTPFCPSKWVFMAMVFPYTFKSSEERVLSELTWILRLSIFRWVRSFMRNRNSTQPFSGLTKLKLHWCVWRQVWLQLHFSPFLRSKNISK